MATKADFTAEEWQTVGIAPILTSMYISMADPSGPIGLMKEMYAAAASVVETAKEDDSIQVIKDLAADMQARSFKPELPKFSSKDEALVYAKAEVGKAIALVESRSPADGPAYRRWLYDTAVRSAEAGKEGGFLGFGGTAVSDAERAALSELAGVLGVSA
ncbi:MAG TPA: hypothetical protein PKD53_26135 [Chloroflexaceae bacterium]|mgnify:CR=1 FL=1|nr:hypothetical protein [Chloroflexaceae bacterium]